MKIKLLLFSAVLLFVVLLSCKKKDETITTISDPIITTLPVTNITDKAASCGGNITNASNGHISARGVCWGVNIFPAIDNNNPNKTVDGDGIGSFNSTITGLLPNQTYYVRAYATNETGTAYGDNVRFTTSAFTSFQFNGKTIFIHPADTISVAWGNPGVVTGATSRSNGSDNTAYIVAQGGSPAAKKCADLVAGGYSDWYLPSRDELNAMFLVKNQVGGFNHPDYWSSTEMTANTAVSQNFAGAGAQDTAASKNLIKACRCIRKD